MKMACCACDGARTVPVRSAWFTKEASEVHDVSWLADVLRTETVRAPLQPGREPSRFAAATKILDAHFSNNLSTFGRAAGRDVPRSRTFGVELFARNGQDGSRN